MWENHWRMREGVLGDGPLPASFHAFREDRAGGGGGFADGLFDRARIRDQNPAIAPRSSAFASPFITAKPRGLKVVGTQDGMGWARSR